MSSVATLPVSRRRARTLPSLVAALSLAALPQLRSFVFGGTNAALSPPRQRHTLVTQALGAHGEAATEAKEQLLDLLDDDMLLGEIMKPESKYIRGRLDESIMQLERRNPTDEPVYSELLDGTWKVKYTGTYAPGLLSSPTRELALFLYSGGFSPSNALASLAAGFWGQTIGFKLGEREVIIQDGRSVAASATVEVAGGKQELKYKAELMPMSSSRMSEEVTSVELPSLGKQEPPLELRRTMLVSYLDETLMIVRDESGVPEVLVRELALIKAEAPANTTAVVNSTNVVDEPVNATA